MKLTTIIITIMGLIILGGVGVYAYNQITEVSYQEGVNDAVILINQQMLNNIYQSGFIPYIIPINETASMNVMLVPQLYEDNIQKLNTMEENK